MGTSENTTQVSNFARDGIVVDLLFSDPTKLVILSPEPAYEDAVENPTAQQHNQIKIYAFEMNKQRRHERTTFSSLKMWVYNMGTKHGSL